MPGLSKRKKDILKAVIDDYIVKATPVSSQDIKDKHLPDISSATIRSEMSALEELGYLLQPHISSGRIPSNAAYKLYANELMQNKPLTSRDIKRIKEQFDEKSFDIEEVIKKAAKIISDITNYTSVILMKDDDIYIRNVKLVSLINNTALVIIITNKQVLKDSFVSLPEGLDENGLETVNDLLNEMFANKNINEISEIDELIDEEMNTFRSVFLGVLDIIKTNIKPENIVTDGEYKILDYPDNDRTDAKKIIEIIKEKNSLNHLIEDSNNIEFSVKIGKEESELENCAVVSAKYMLGGREIGRAGVIGPVRMDYSKVYSVLNYVCKMLDKIIK